MRQTCWRFGLLALSMLTLGVAAADFAPLPAGEWRIEKREVKGLDGELPVILVHPAKSRAPAAYTSAQPLAAGVYRLRITLRPSHVADGIAWATQLTLTGDGIRPLGPASWEGIMMTRVNQPETVTATVLLPERRPLSFTLAGNADASVIEQARATAEVKGGKMAQPTLGLDTADAGGLDELGELDLAFVIAPKTHVYWIVDRVEIQPLSASAYVGKVAVDKVRYRPGETAAATVAVVPVEGRASGTLRLYLEHRLRQRELVAERELTLTGPTTESFTIDLPEEQFGYALVAEWSTPAGDRHEAAEVFGITDQVWRTAIHYVRPVHGETFSPPERYEQLAQKMQADYQNVREFFFWAEEDMVEMSPDSEYWFSGQTTYHMSLTGLREMIAALHRHGIGASTYGKFIMSGYLGWKTAYDYPFDHKGQYAFPLGMWEGTSVPALDRFQNREFASIAPVKGGLFGHELGGLPFMPINPDPTPRNVRIAAEEVKRSVAMFGWDAIRWDGHPRGSGTYGNSCGGARPEKYDYAGHRQTQLLVHYFKDIVDAAYPGFGHGYNYLFATENPTYDWAVEDFELDELSRGGGLLMNESIGNHGFGQPYSWFVANLQEEGDLARERGAFYLGIGHGEAPRDKLVHTVLWYAAGARPYGATADNRILNRYATRFSRYVFDERLVRLAKPEGVLKPAAATPLHWQPFVFVTSLDNGHAELVVNLLNLPMNARTAAKGDKEGEPAMSPGTDPVGFALTLPEGYRAVGASLIDPFTLNVESLPLADGRFTAPPVALWRVLVIDLAVADGAPLLGELYGPPKTLGKQREKLSVERRGFDPLDLDKDVVEVNKNMAAQFPSGNEREFWQEDPALAAMDMASRNAALLDRRVSMETFIKMYPYGVKLPDDRKLMDSPPDFGNLTPRRNGVADIFLARGAMDYRIRAYEAIARLERFRVREARYIAPFSGKHHGLEDNLGPREYADFDLAIFEDVPHAAIGVQQSYALNEWVKAGGGALFFGGEYAFSKGRYAYTILDRELLPVVCVDLRDNRYVQEPLAIAPGPDFAELGVDADFATPPVFWGWSEVALRPDAKVKVFLQAGNRPILVGWEHGKGRVACFLAMHRGTSEDGQLAWFDWPDWPDTMAAVLRWLSPEAATEAPDPRALTAAAEEALATRLTGGALDDLLADDPEALGAGGARELPAAALAERTADIRRLLVTDTPRSRRLLAEQLTTVANLPLGLRLAMLRAIAQGGPDEALAAIARKAADDRDSLARASALCLLGWQGDDAFVKALNERAPALEAQPLMRQRLLAMGAAVSPDDSLLPRARELVEGWNAQEAAAMKSYTGGEPFSLRAPEVPCLDTESYYARVAWLAYLARREPDAWGGQFLRQWTLLPQYVDWSRRCIINIDEGLAQGAPSPAQRLAANQQKEALRDYQVCLRNLQELLAPLASTVFAAHPAASQALEACHFRAEAVPAINLLGELPAADAAIQLRHLQAAGVALLRDTATRRYPGRGDRQ